MVSKTRNLISIWRNNTPPKNLHEFNRIERFSDSSNKLVIIGEIMWLDTEKAYAYRFINVTLQESAKIRYLEVRHSCLILDNKYFKQIKKVLYGYLGIKHVLGIYPRTHPPVIDTTNLASLLKPRIYINN